MAYVGTPIDTTNQFQSLQGKRFSGDGSTTAFTLDVAPSSTLDIEVFVENVRQDPNSAYTLSGTTLTFTGAPPSGTNNIYVVHQAKAVGTIDVPAGGVAADSLATSVLTGQTDIGAAIADADLFLVDDGAGGTLRKTAASRLKTYIGQSTPLFDVVKTADQDISDATWTKVTFNSERIDSDSAFDLSNDKFVVPSGEAGKYFFSVIVVLGNKTANNTISDAYSGIAVNGTRIRDSLGYVAHSAYPSRIQSVTTIILDLSVDDYVEAYGYVDVTSGTAQFRGSANGQTCFSGFKLTG